jgi:hypothetical protein
LSISLQNIWEYQLVSKTFGNINYQLQCEAYATINPVLDCKCDQVDVCQLPIYQLNYNCNNDYRCTQPIFDQKCSVKVEECYTIDAERGFTTSDQTQVITYNQVTSCNSSDSTCPKGKVNQLLRNTSIWYQSDDLSDWRYDELNPSESDKIVMICFGAVIITFYLVIAIIWCAYQCGQTQLQSY